MPSADAFINRLGDDRQKQAAQQRIKANREQYPTWSKTNSKATYELLLLHLLP